MCQAVSEVISGFLPQVKSCAKRLISAAKLTFQTSPRELAPRVGRNDRGKAASVQKLQISRRICELGPLLRWYMPRSAARTMPIGGGNRQGLGRQGVIRCEEEILAARVWESVAGDGEIPAGRMRHRQEVALRFAKPQACGCDQRREDGDDALTRVSVSWREFLCLCARCHESPAHRADQLRQSLPRALKCEKYFRAARNSSKLL